MDDAQGKRISLRLEQPGAVIGTMQQPSRFLDFDLTYASEDDVKGIVRNAWITFPMPSVVPAPTK